LLAEQSNLLQSWNYGEAKKEMEGWKLKRGIFFRKGEPVAMVQMLQKRIGLLMLVSRINRGPLFLVNDFTVTEKMEVINYLSPFGNIGRLRVLFFAPELRLSGASLSNLYYAGFRKFSARFWESVWVNLNTDLETLRKKMDSKWRNMLNYSEKAGLTVEHDSGPGMFEWMLDQYSNVMEENGFKGPSEEFIRSLHRQANGRNSVIVLRAIKNEMPVAGVCLAIHGAGATYLLGFNSQEGRNLKANQYLLWQAILYLKENKIKWFDLGGIDLVNTPGITQFKLGLNGERYENSGDFIKW
jgi:lipid II:glycine glycyltransferase (peptidoglycan interpeptide bridge formation enzyme)